MQVRDETQGAMGPRLGSVIAAALALPGVATAQSAVNEGLIGVRYLYYKDQQPGLDRITVKSPSIYALVPFASGNWSVEGSLVSDSLSGATPRFYTVKTNASKMEDDRKAGDLKITRYFRRSAIGLGVAGSTEDDYNSRSISTDVRLSTDDNNTTFAAGFGFADDNVYLSKNDPVTGKLDVARDYLGGKQTRDLMFGVTQVLSPVDIVKVNITHARAQGYLSDPYRQDVRPRERNATALLTQWNHHFAGTRTTVRTSYRYYNDSFDVQAHTLGLDVAQGFGDGWLVTPSLRFYDQSAASFYLETDGSTPPSAYRTADYRLSAFGGVTAGLKVTKQVTPEWTVDVRYDLYEQRASWRVAGEGSTGLDPFKATFIQLGIYRRF